MGDATSGSLGVLDALVSSPSLALSPIRLLAMVKSAHFDVDTLPNAKISGGRSILQLWFENIILGHSTPDVEWKQSSTDTIAATLALFRHFVGGATWKEYHARLATWFAPGRVLRSTSPAMVIWQRPLSRLAHEVLDADALAPPERRIFGSRPSAAWMIALSLVCRSFPTSRLDLPDDRDLLNRLLSLAPVESLLSAFWITP
jgi:hypothetical protein